MSEASKALADVRAWLCDNLGASDAGHVCGMLSVVSRRVVQADELEAENAKLRELAYVSLNYCANGYCSVEDGCPMNTVDGKGLCGYVRACRELGIEELDA